jgi:hypothetical protein
MEKFLETMYGFSQKMDLKTDILKDALLQFVKLSDESPFWGISSIYMKKTRKLNN